MVRADATDAADVVYNYKRMAVADYGLIANVGGKSRLRTVSYN